MAQNVAAFTLHQSLRSDLDIELEVPDLEDQDAVSFSFELCRTFAGIERQFDDNPAVLYPCFVPMTMAAVACTPNVRRWMSSKLRHFEEQGQICVNTVRRNIAVSWNMPEIVTEGFGGRLLEKGSDVQVVSEDLEITLGSENVNVDLEEGNVEEDAFTRNFPAAG